MDLGLIRKVDLDDEMQQSYLDYAMSVIVSRALPDARDGLKPVQRRILYAMYDMGLRPETGYKKSARIVGEVLGKYHPHGDMAVYEAMARLAQDFSLRYPLVDGQGNFGSVDGDPPAAMRYTEARLTRVAMEMLIQLDKNTVDFGPNFDETLTEPSVLPAAIPNLLVNGATGIAVGMATNIPPHNLGEVVDALVFMLNQWDKLDDLTVPDLLKFIQGPDFPTGGVIIQDPAGEGLMGAYGSGRGRVIVQARAHMEEMVRGRNRIIVTELPYQTNKSALIERIADLVRDGVIEGIADLRDESDRQGMRIVIELSKTADPEHILRQLYKQTPMQSTFGINLLALVEGEPRLLTLKQALRVYLDHRLVVVKRRSQYDLEKAQARAHILEGLRIALKNLDEIITLIRNSPDAEQARLRLIKRFKLSELQAQAILDMPLRRLASLERKKIEQEYQEMIRLIQELEALLRSPRKMRQVVSDELVSMKATYADRRRTLIVRLKEGTSATALLTTTDVTTAQSVWVGVTGDGKIARTIDDRLPVLGEGAAPHWLVRADTHQTLYLVSQQGRAAAIPVHAVPEASSPAMGANIYKVTPLSEEEPLAALFALPNQAASREGSFALTVTRQGMVKKTALGELPGPSAQTFTLVKVNDGDALGWVRQTNGSAEVLLATARGMAIRFKEEEVRPMGLAAAGVGGIKLAAGDEVIGAEALSDQTDVLLAANNGKAKRVPLADFPTQGRYGQGTQAWKLSGEARLAGMHAGKAGEQVAIRAAGGSSQVIALSAVPLKTRAVQGAALDGWKSGELLEGLTEISGAVAEPAPEPVRGKKATPAPRGKAGSQKAKADGQAEAPVKKPGKKKATEAPAAKSASDGAGHTSRTKPTPNGKPATRAAEAAEPSRDGKSQAKEPVKKVKRPPEGEKPVTAEKVPAAKPKAAPKRTASSKSILPKQEAAKKPGPSRKKTPPPASDTPPAAETEKPKRRRAKP